ncbi:hypothetical protein SUGI_0963950 [Cryptomeria japonica]|nr:hypothetical protein SUGI_0963950 [Cryptomeria japonica]
MDEVVNGKLQGKRIYAYLKWDKDMESIWDLKECSPCIFIDKRSRRQDVRWEVPPPGWMKLNFDGASKGNPGVAGYGAIIRNELGRLIYAVSGEMGIASDNEAELCTLEAGLKLCVEKGLSKIIIEGDSQVVIIRVMQSRFCSWRLNSWILMIRDILNKMYEFHLTHAYREGNRAVDWLANEGLRTGAENVLSEETTLQNDLSAILG